MHCKFCGQPIASDTIPTHCPKCKAEFKKEFRLRRPGEMIGKYRVLRLLGRGGAGAVYLCDHPELMIRCAVKVLNDEKASRDKVFVERLLREAKIAAALQRPDVVAVLDAGIDEENHEPFIVMEYIDGESLEEVLKDGPLPENAVLGIALRIAAILADTEKKGIVHRDIKPANILLTSDGNIKLADLGIAKSGVVTNDTISEKDILLGTPNYAAPEQLRNASLVDSRADIYSLGATMYHMLSGVRPFHADTVFNTIAKVLETEMPPLCTYSQPISTRTAALVHKMMQKNPDNRIQNAHELLKKLNKCMEKKSVFREKVRSFFIRNAPRYMRRRDKVRRVRIMTPAKIMRDIFLSFAVLLCLLFSWFNFGNAYSEKRQKEHIEKLETLRKQEVNRLLNECDIKNLSAFLSSHETGYRSRREIFSALLRNSEKQDLLLNLISSDIFSGRKNEDFLGIACSYPHTTKAVIEELIRAGAELDYRDRRGRTALMKAIATGNTDAVNLLLNYGADPNLIDKEGRNVLFYLPEKFTVELLDSLLASDISVNVRDNKGRTPLMVYVERFDEPEMVKLLRSKRFNLNRRASSGDSALTTAVKRRHMKSAELLFNMGIKFDRKDADLVSKEYRLRNMMDEKLKTKR